jgi:hypothetical protein
MPIFVDERYELIHQVRHFFEVRRNMTAYIDGLFPKATSELWNPCNRDVVESPQRVLVQRGRSVLKAYFYECCEKIVLSSEVFFLKSFEEVRLALSQHQHLNARASPFDELFWFDEKSLRRSARRRLSDSGICRCVSIDETYSLLRQFRVRNFQPPSLFAEPIQLRMRRRWPKERFSCRHDPFLPDPVQITNEK